MTAAQRLPFWHPVSLIATWFGSGLLPWVPGTWGSLAALPFAIAIAALGGPWLLLAAALCAFGLGVWASSVYADNMGAEDPGPVVIDEVAGMWLALVPFTLDLSSYTFAFLFFRLFDIIKVWPANIAERRLKGGWGIMTDDMIAGVYAAAATYAVHTLIGL